MKKGLKISADGIDVYLSNKIKGQRNPRGLDAVEILGEEKAVETIAGIWQTHGKYFKMTELALLLEYCQTQNYTKEEFQAYRMGLQATNMFMENCLLQIHNRTKSS